MTSQPAPTPLIVRVIKHLPLAEKVFLSTLAIGTILTVMRMDSMVATLSWLGLGAIFFLSAYRPIGIPAQEGEQFGFPALLGLVILPKVLWISSAVSATGIAFYMLDLDPNGYKKMLMIGGSTSGIGALLLVALMVRGVKHMKFMAPILLRAVPLCFVDFYLLLFM